MKVHGEESQSWEWVKTSGLKIKIASPQFKAESFPPLHSLKQPPISQSVKIPSIIDESSEIVKELWSRDILRKLFPLLLA